MSTQPETTPDWTAVLDALEAHLDARDALMEQHVPGRDQDATLATTAVELPAVMHEPTVSERTRARALALRIEEQLAALTEALGAVRSELDRVASQRSHPSPHSVATAPPSRLDQHA